MGKEEEEVGMGRRFRGLEVDDRRDLCMRCLRVFFWMMRIDTTLDEMEGGGDVYSMSCGQSCLGMEVGEEREGRGGGGEE